MELGYVFACGVLWSGTGDPESGWQLIRALRDPDEQVRNIAREMLAGGDNSLALLHAATAAGLLTGEEAASVVAALLEHGGGMPADRRAHC